MRKSLCFFVGVVGLIALDVSLRDTDNARATDLDNMVINESRATEVGLSDIEKEDSPSLQ